MTQSTTDMLAPNPVRLDRQALPQPVYDADQRLVDLYWTAWEQAWGHVTARDGVPQSPYMDEGFGSEKIWIWDTCFMALFCRYGAGVFPGIESFKNIYAPMHDGADSSLVIWHLDNPPLMAWAEHLYVQMTGDLDRIRWLLRDRQYLQKHYAFIENCVRWQRYPGSTIGVLAERRLEGFYWWGCASGMDNTPRGRLRPGTLDHETVNQGHFRILWFDLLAQQALAAEHIAHLARLVGDKATAAEYEQKRQAARQTLDRYYWNAEDGIYYDCLADDVNTQLRVMTPAAYWPMLAGLCSREQAAALARHAEDPQVFGGQYPWPSVARKDVDFVADGGAYWRGGIWLPVAYAATKALERYGYHELADRLALRVVDQMVRTYHQYEPHTIWESYHPSAAEPARHKDNQKVVRHDFCGWSALGPISMFIENVLGFRRIDALQRRVEWDVRQGMRHGLKNLRFGDVVADLLSDGLGTITVRSSGPFRLVVRQQVFDIPSGQTTLET